MSTFKRATIQTNCNFKIIKKRSIECHLLSSMYINYRGFILSYAHERSEIFILQRLMQSFIDVIKEVQT